MRQDEFAMENGTARTAAFNAWYDNNKVKDAYENGYQVNVMTNHWENEIDHKDNYNTSIKAKEVIETLCVNTDGSNYYKDDPEKIASGKFTDISSSTKNFLDEYFAKREKITSQKPDKSYKTLEVRANSNKDKYLSKVELKDRKPLNVAMLKKTALSR